MKDLDKYKGCLIGGAIGDALGYPVEFMSAALIFSRYGQRGINDYELSDRWALISDDTQMTLFTAYGVICGRAADKAEGVDRAYIKQLENAYREWHAIQTRANPMPALDHYSQFIMVTGMRESRAPGRTCMSALRQEQLGSIERPINNSKGCGGVMRVAPIGLYFDVPREEQAKVDRLGAEAAALTHGHELGYIPAAALVHIISLIAHDPNMTLLDAVLDMKASIGMQFAGADRLQEFLEGIDRAIGLAKTSADDLVAIRQLGEGWVGDEALDIALYCVLKYQDDFEKAIVAAVNHDGDSDSTGSITGNILGAYLGLKSIPEKYLKNLELMDLLTTMAEDLYRDCQSEEDAQRIASVWQISQMGLCDAAEEDEFCEEYAPWAMDNEDDDFWPWCIPDENPLNGNHSGCPPRSDGFEEVEDGEFPF